MSWPVDAAVLEEEQRRLALARPPLWQPGEELENVAGVFVCFPRGGQGAGGAGDPGWVGAAAVSAGRVTATVCVEGRAGAPYRAGYLALREGALLEAAVRALLEPPELLLVNGTGRDHPRGAGMALHLGSVLGVPTIGVTHRPLCAEGSWPDKRLGAASPLWQDGAQVASWLRTRTGARPVVVHPGWRVEPEVSLACVRALSHGARTPLPLQAARRAAREGRAERSQWSGATAASTAGSGAFPARADPLVGDDWV